MFKDDYLAEKLAKEYVRTQGTIRSVAKKYGIPKSRVHNLIKEIIEDGRLCGTDLAEEVKELIIKNKSERHFRGGSATKAKFEKMKK